MEIFPPPVATVSFSNTTIAVTNAGTFAAQVTSLPALAAGSNVIGAAQTQIEAAVAGGYSYGASVIASLTVLSGNQRVLISNPNGSGKTLYIYSIIVASTNAALLTASVFKNPTVVPSTGITIQNMLIAGSAGVGTMAADGSGTALSGGTAWVNLDIGVTGRAQVLPSPIAIPPNNSVGINIPYVATVTSDVTILWYEK